MPKPFVKPESSVVPAGSFTLAIMKYMMRLEKELANPDAKHNQGKLIGEAYLWRAIQKYAEQKYEALMGGDRKVGALFTEGVLEDKSTLDPGTHDNLAESPSFRVSAKTTVPIKRFDPQMLATNLITTFKLKAPRTVVLALIEASKKETKSQTTYKIEELVK